MAKLLREKEYWQEVDGKAAAILGVTEPRYSGWLPRHRYRSTDWQSQEYAGVLLFESARKRFRNFGRYAVFETVLLCDNPVSRPAIDEPWVSRELYFDPAERKLSVHTIPYNPSQVLTNEERMSRVKAYTEEDLAGLSEPTQEDYGLLLGQLRLGYIEQAILSN